MGKHFLIMKNEFRIRFFLIYKQGYCMSSVVKKGDIYRIINGYDDCANVCGRITPQETEPRFSCKGANMKDKP